MSNKILEEVKGYKEWIINNRKGFVISVAGTAVVVSVIGAGFGIIPLNNAKNTAQTEYDKIMTKYRASLVVNADLEQEIATLKGTISNLVDERDGLKLQLEQAEQPAEEEDTEEAVYKQIDKHSDTSQQAKNRKAIYNSIGHLIVRSIFKK